MTDGLAWFDLSKLDAGTRVVFVRPHDIYPECIVPAGTTGTIKENGLNEIWCILTIEVDDPEIRKALAHWDGLVQLAYHLDPGANFDQDPDDFTDRELTWFEDSPIAVAP